MGNEGSRPMRRDSACVLLALSHIVVAPVYARSPVFMSGDFLRVRMYNQCIGEMIVAIYTTNGAIIPKAVPEFSRFTSDRRRPTATYWRRPFLVDTGKPYLPRIDGERVCRRAQQAAHLRRGLRPYPRRGSTPTAARSSYAWSAAKGSAGTVEAGQLNPEEVQTFGPFFKDISIGCVA